MSSYTVGASRPAPDVVHYGHVQRTVGRATRVRTRCSALTRLPQSRGTDGPHVSTTCNRVRIPRVTVYVYHVYPCDYSSSMAGYKLCRRMDSLSLHVYACIITLYRGYCVQYSSYAGTPVFITVFYLIIIN